MQNAQVSRVANMLGGLAVAISDELALQSREAALLAVDSHPGQSVAHLSTALGRSHSATVRLVGGLVTSGLATRGPGKNPRSVSIALTPAGKRAAGELRAARLVLLEALLEGFTEEQISTVEPLLERLLAAAATDPDARWRICRLCEERLCEEGHPACPVDAAAPRGAEPS